MKIVYFLPDVEAGVSRIVRTLLQYKPSTDVAYWVILMRLKQNPGKNPVNEPFAADRTILFTYDYLDNLYTTYTRLAAYLDTDDIIVGNDGYEIRMVAALKLKNPVVYIVHGDFDYYYRVCKLNKSIIDLFIVYSEEIFKKVGNYLGAEQDEKVRLLYYPSSALNGTPVTNVKNPVFTIIFAGSLDKRKGAHLLWEIYEELRKNQIEFNLEIIGDGELKEQIESQFLNCSNVLVSGWQANAYILDRLSAAHVFLFPSFLEGLPNVLVEALSRGVVPVSSKLDSGINDIIKHNSNGLLVETGNIAAFAEAIIYLYSQPKILAVLQQNSKKELAKFEPRQQSKVYHDAIVSMSIVYRPQVTIFPNYPMGGILNKPWLPNDIVRIVRHIFKHPKL